jgi:hypothetical protein
MPQLEPMPLTRRLARESVWALGCVLVVGTFFVTVLSNMEGGPHEGPLAISPSAWAVLWNEWLGGHFLMATGVVYGLVLTVRLATWAVGMARRSH